LRRCGGQALALLRVRRCSGVLETLERGELLLQLEHRLEEVALLLDPPNRSGNLETELLGGGLALCTPLDLIPVKRD
jgi:hypothetical protein